MDNRVKTVIEREQAKKNANIELREKYRRVLRRTVADFDANGNQHVIYENIKMLDKVQNVLDTQTKKMDQVSKELEDRLKHTQKKMAGSETAKLQQRIEILNQQIRILEATWRNVVANDRSRR